MSGNRNMNAHFVRPVAVNTAKHSLPAIVPAAENVTFRTLCVRQLIEFIIY